METAAASSSAASSAAHAHAAAAATAAAAAATAAAAPAAVGSALASPPPLPPHRRLRIAWAHRHEHDKRPELFFETLRWLHAERGLDFEVTVLGEAFAQEPSEFSEARRWLEAAGKVAHWGFAPDRATYLRALAACDVAVSTAAHEFFGLAMAEAAALGCFPLCPAGLAYPELLAPSEADCRAIDEAGAPECIRALVRSKRRPTLLFEVMGSIGGGAGEGIAGGGGQGSGRGALKAAAAPGDMEAAAPSGSPFLWASRRELRARLEAMARRPNETVRAWRAAQARAPQSAASRAVEAAAEAPPGAAAAKRTKFEATCATALAAPAPLPPSSSSPAAVPFAPPLDLSRLSSAVIGPRFAALLLP